MTIFLVVEDRPVNFMGHSDERIPKRAFTLETDAWKWANNHPGNNDVWEIQLDEEEIRQG